MRSRTTLRPPLLISPFLSTGIIGLLFNLDSSFDKGKGRYKSAVRDIL